MIKYEYLGIQGIQGYSYLNTLEQNTGSPFNDERSFPTLIFQNEWYIFPIQTLQNAGAISLAQLCHRLGTTVPTLWHDRATCMALP